MKNLIKNFILLIFTISYVQLSAQNPNPNPKYAVIISANAEWKVIREVYPDENYQKSPWGEYFFKDISDGKKTHSVLFFHEGWGKIAAAGGTQYVIDEWHPEILINLGTCGGFKGKTKRFDVILANKTIVYDIIEAMVDSKEAIEDYSTEIDLSWLGTDYPVKVTKTLLVSADRDLVLDEILQLEKEYNAVAGDWETGAIAYVAARNKIKILILRGVSDLVSTKRGEAYGNFELFVERTATVMKDLLTDLPKWLAYIEKK